MGKQYAIRTLIVFSIILLNAGASHEQTENRRDGNWWLAQSELGKSYYVTGFFDGMTLGNQFSYWGISDKDDPARAKAVASYSEFGDKYLKHVTSGQMVDGLDKLYSDYKNRRIMVWGAVWLVANGIAGKSEAELQGMIESWRKNASQ